MLAWPQKMCLEESVERAILIQLLDSKLEIAKAWVAAAGVKLAAAVCKVAGKAAL